MGLCHIYFNEDVCDGCNACVEVCMCDTFAPNPEKGKPPIVMYPEECWFGGCCISACPHRWEGAIRIVTPFQMRGTFRGQEPQYEDQLANPRLTEHGTAASKPYKPSQ